MKNEVEFKFGDYAIIEQKRHGVPNEMFVHKVVGQLRSNTWVDVPVSVPATETLHGEMEDICLCICCGIDETKVRRYRVKDMRRHSPISLVADEKSGSTIKLQAVNELIASLESAGELSIREQKFLKLAKAFKQLAAENVGLKSFGDKLDGMHNALNGEGTGIQGRAEVACQQVALEAAMEEFDAIETPTTDRIVAGIKADGRAEGINFAASRLAAAFNHGFVDKPMAEVGDVVRMILTAKEDLAKDPVLAADGLSGEYAEKSLAEWEAALSDGASYD
ncbi:hypothetical protein [Klebsiella pneumoniae]|uniref:hypothetical protein n=1 Tax=Klebsiella pneumoniae TaxID=573 RepID=UPI002AF6B203|nr:hypothetical protein [Klebsiella pneumoniae]